MTRLLHFSTVIRAIRGLLKFGATMSPRVKGVVSIVSIIVVIAMTSMLIMEGVGKIRDSEARAVTLNNLRQVALGFHAFQDNFRRLPTPRMHLGGGPATEPFGLSWRLGLEPYLISMMEHSIFKKADWNEPWDGPKNRELLPLRYGFFEDPTRFDVPAGQTTFQVVVGPETLFDGTKRTFAEIPDGAANTLLVVSATDAVPWIKPEDLIYDPVGPLPRMGDPKRRERILFATADGSVHTLVRPAEEVLRALITAGGNETLDFETILRPK